MLVRFTTRPEQHSPFLQRTRSYQQFPTFSGAQHSSVYYWVPTTRLPGPGGHSSTVGGFGYPVDLELARSAPQRSGSAAVAPLCNPPREGQDGAGTHHRGEEAPRWPQAARAAPARHRPGAAGAGRAEAREPRPGRREGDRAGLGTPAGRAQPERQKGRAGVRLGQGQPSPDRAYPAPRGPSTIAAAASHKGPGPPCPARRGGGAAGRGQTLHPPSLSPRRPGPPPPPGPQRPPPSRRRQRPPPHGRKQRPPTAGRSQEPTLSPWGVKSRVQACLSTALQKLTRLFG